MIGCEGEVGGEVSATAQVSAFVGRLNVEGDVIPEDSLGVVAGLGNGVGMGGGQRRGETMSSVSSPEASSFLFMAVAPSQITVGKTGKSDTFPFFFQSLPFLQA